MSYREVKLTYDKKELNDLLRRNTGKDHECVCSCVYTGSSIWLAIQFVCKKCLFPKLIEKVSLEIFKQISSRSCFIGSRFVTVASIIFEASQLIFQGKSVYIGIYDKPIYLSKAFFSKALFITPASLRERNKLIKKELSKEERYRVIVRLILDNQESIEEEAKKVTEYLRIMDERKQIEKKNIHTKMIKLRKEKEKIKREIFEQHLNVIKDIPYNYKEKTSFMGIYACQYCGGKKKLPLRYLKTTSNCDKCDQFTIFLVQEILQ